MSTNSKDMETGGRPVQKAVTPGGHTLDQDQGPFPQYHRKLGNPAPLGLSAFALTTFFLSMVNVKARGVSTPNVTVALALGYGGLVQLLAGMWEFASGNTFGAFAFSSYGGFWISYAFILIPWSGVAAAYTESTELDNALGIYLASWFIFTSICLIGSLRTSIGLIVLFFFLDLTFLFLFAFYFTGKPALQTTGGAFGIITAFVAWWCALGGLLTKETSYFQVPVGNLGPR